MTAAEWNCFTALIADPTLPTDENFRAWFWGGTHPNPGAQARFPAGGGIEADLAFIRFETLNRLFGRQGLPAPVARRYVVSAIQMLRSQNLQAGLVRLVQRKGQELVDLVDGYSPLEQLQVVDALQPLWYILRDLARLAALEEVARLCEYQRAREEPSPSY